MAPDNRTADRTDPVAVQAVPAQAKVLEYAVTVDRGGRMTIPGGAQIDARGGVVGRPPPARRARPLLDRQPHVPRAARRPRVVAAGEGSGRVTKREEGRALRVRRARRADRRRAGARVDDPRELLAKAERDCFVGASLTIDPRLRMEPRVTATTRPRSRRSARASRRSSGRSRSSTARAARRSRTR